jgi:hypothetical protein
MSPAPVLSARLLAPLERLPESLSESLTHLSGLDHNWVWVVEHKGVVSGYIAACYCHGLALILRLRMERNLPNAALVVLFRRFFLDVRDRGCEGYMSFFEIESDTEKRLMLLTRKTGGVIASRPLVQVCSKLPPEGML